MYLHFENRFSLTANSLVKSNSFSITFQYYVSYDNFIDWIHSSYIFTHSRGFTVILHKCLSLGD